MKGLLVFGRSGQVATELSRLAPEARFIGRDAADLSDASCLAGLIASEQPTAIINAAAHTAVDRAESEPELAHAINAEAPFVMARAAAKLSVPFLHISTDYVFDGSGERPWAETDPTGPLGVYGASKLAGERGVAHAGGQWAVLRTSWVFSAHGANFVKTMMRLGAEREELRVVADQHGGPTPAAAIASACLEMVAAMHADPAKGGIYHFAGAPDTSWAGFAREIIDQVGIPCRISEIATSDYPTPARRPGNSRLDCRAITRDFGIERPDWRTGLTKVLTELRK
ncbi:dTDP-4-dehydrorhamnose reductase [Paracoccus aestuariivivens]|uniref:dTDP-4-dehydrorhamnose reductase n=1 Tax=Paracoccus aestuariivivens TaxID=1820333 RepID=A0A6L6JHY5_9RHOB|nr:dTDP-4-dehydrorhamnose reductase [Paracoccus aestuariivivens]MTH80339.1 dTDP-4-dehydrorhamnose reductase [Paracoccus aestuariivivens]